MNIGSCLRLPALGLAALFLAGGTASAGIKIIELDATWSPDTIAAYCERHDGILWGVDDNDAFGRYGCLTDEHAVECDADGNCITDSVTDVNVDAIANSYINAYAITDSDVYSFTDGNGFPNANSNTFTRWRKPHLFPQRT